MKFSICTLVIAATASAAVVTVESKPETKGEAKAVEPKVAESVAAVSGAVPRTTVSELAHASSPASLATPTGQATLTLFSASGESSASGSKDGRTASAAAASGSNSASKSGSAMIALVVSAAFLAAVQF
ncbi:hypothetical protein DL89DRAFT_263697 [Linderina pennispora]|uniref:Uncharacterized protein n=1 Tax=Linderina pennispora TaxID=61395 RepID=A0A1Y1WK16_9FUNG|nr:uncharacterized protein DL89DRAFT_263697 [Linderina pennispora]ORX73668.1 hypothetical protein DL89DRAFT_263697 [Linderina pennispora]